MVDANLASITNLDILNVGFLECASLVADELIVLDSEVRISGLVFATNGIVLGAGATVTGDGSGLTNLPADQLTGGPVPLAVLSGITSNELAESTVGTNKLDETAFLLLMQTGTNSGIGTNAVALWVGDLVVSNTAIFSNLTVGSLALSNKMVGSNVIADYTISSNQLDAGTWVAATNGSWNWGSFLSFQELPTWMMAQAHVGHDVLQARIADKTKYFRRFAALGAGVTNQALISCMSTSLPGTLILLSNGVHNIGPSNVLLNTNCLLVGESMSNTVIVTSEKTVRLVPLTGATIANLTYTNITPTNDLGYSGGIGNAAPYQAQTDVLMVNVMCFGNEDSTYFFGDAEIKLFNYLGFGRWDNFTCGCAKADLFNCYFYTDDTVEGNIPDTVHGVRWEGGGLVMRHCFVTNNITGTHPVGAPLATHGVYAGNGIISIADSSVGIIGDAVGELLDPIYGLDGSGGWESVVIRRANVLCNYPDNVVVTLP